MKTAGIFLIIPFAISCNVRSIKSEVHGTVTNLADGTPLAGYEVHLVEKMTPLDLASPVTETVIATAMVGTNGHFMFEEELRRDSRRDYLVVFDPANDFFSPNGLTLRTGAEVAMTALIEKEQNLQFVKLSAVPNGFVSYRIQNNTEKRARFELYIMNEINYSRVLDVEIENDESTDLDYVDRLTSGFSEFIVKRSIDGQFVDSTVFEWVIPQNDTTLVELIINEP